jgi:hypothetical protein
MILSLGIVCSLFAIRYSLFAIRYSLFAIRYSLQLRAFSGVPFSHAVPAAGGGALRIHE